MDCVHQWLKEPHVLVNHHISSYNQFIQHIPTIIHKQNPRIILKKKMGDDFQLKCKMYVGGKDGKLIEMGRPFFTENDTKKVMYPNDARLRNLTYSFSVHAKLTFAYTLPTGETSEFTTEDYVFIGNFPIMLQSNICVLNAMPPEVMFNMGECSRDPGGYFIVDGSEKVLICQEGRANNSICVLKNFSDKYYYRAELRSESEDESQLPRNTAVQIATHTNSEHEILNRDGVSLHEIVVELPNVRLPIPLFIVMRALGIVSDKQIIQTCLLGNDPMLMERFRESIYDAGDVFSQMTALKYISTFAKYQTVDHVLFILSELTLPHIGSTNFIDKAYFLGYMVKKLLMTATNAEPITDRDSFRYKRIDSTGILLDRLFRDYYIKQLKHVQLIMDRTYKGNEKMYETAEGFPLLFQSNYALFFEERVTENGIIKAFKGNWEPPNIQKRKVCLKN